MSSRDRCFSSHLSIHTALQRGDEAVVGDKLTASAVSKKAVETADA